MKKQWVYVVIDSEGSVSYHKTLRSATRRGPNGMESQWKQVEEAPRRWRAGSVEAYHVTITEVRLWD